ncbi:MAG TPA: metallophosphoesterase family protein [Acidimicrobiales bacterium]|nr:metallophosphoesterase family protein [Acidimicrobiales bacterium]
MAKLEVVVLADTHLRDGVTTRLPEVVVTAMQEADLVLHAGDVVSASAWEELRRLAEVRAVLGNNDHELVGLLPETLVLDLEGVEVAMVHDAGPMQGREGRLQRRFPAAEVVIFGHSHVPVDQRGLDGQLLFNPGSPTQRRTHPHRAMGRLTVADGRVLSHRIEAV